tara:strand:- start:7142 stop:8983 length:1842 start_codon:yes stop_codon:yes gene_type:complete
VTDTKNKLIPIRNRSFLNKDFNDLRSQLLDYARTYFPDRIQDFSESSLGGLFLDLAAYVGDVNSFYLDHQFRELDPETAVERENIERMARNSGVDIRGATPAVVDVTFTLRVPAERVGTIYRPNTKCLPLLRRNSSVLADNDVTFSLVDDLDFSETDSIGELLATKKVSVFNADGTPSEYEVSRQGSCVSGDRRTESFTIPDDNVPFRTITLGAADISEVIDVRDIEGNIYYEVDFLTEDTVFSSVENIDDDNKLVKDNIVVIPAPFRFTKQYSSTTALTTIQFGSGDANTIEGDIIPDPSELALPLFGKKQFSRFTVDPTRLLRTRTLGISPRNTTLSVQYRSGGGSDHNVSARSISVPSGIIMTFPEGPTAANELSVRASISVINQNPALGGDDAQTIEEIRALIGSARNNQNRIVTKQDLISRIYSMPTNFGSVFRVGLGSNSRNPLASNLFILSKDGDGFLSFSPDALKKNLSTYLDQFRLVSDAIDILDGKIVNISIEFEIAADPNFNADSVLSRAIEKIVNYMDISNFQIGQPIRLSDLNNLIYNTPGVVSVIDIKVVNISSDIGARKYSSVVHNIPLNTRKGLILPPAGGIFELKYSNFDVKGSAS